MEQYNQVCNRELSMKLRDLGTKQDSLQYWCIYEDWFLAHRDSGIADTNNQVSAYTIEELVEMLYLFKSLVVRWFTSSNFMILTKTLQQMVDYNTIKSEYDKCKDILTKIMRLVEVIK